MRYGNHKLVANLDKHEYYAMTDGWLAHLAVLNGTLPPDLPVAHPLVGSWRSCHVEVVAAGPGLQARAVTELNALCALQGRGGETAYWNVRANFADVGPKLGRLIACEEWLHGFCFQEAAGTSDFSRLTAEEAQRLLRGVRRPLGIAYFRAYKNWLARRWRLPPDVRAALEYSGDRADLSCGLTQAR